MSRIWSFWVESWRSPARARWVYATMCAGFTTLAVVAIILDDILVATLGGLFAVITFSLAVGAARLARWLDKDRRSLD
jgi:hypothetical protein